MSLACSVKFLGQFGHVNLPVDGGESGTTLWILGTISKIRGGCVKDESRLDIDPFIDSKFVDPCGEGEMEVWFPLSSSSEGLETVEPIEVSEREGYRTAQPPVTYWLASETDSVRSR